MSRSEGRDSPPSENRPDVGERLRRVFLSVISASLASVVVDLTLGQGVTKELVPSAIVIEGNRLPIYVLAAFGIFGVIFAEFKWGQSHLRRFWAAILSIAVIGGLAFLLLGGAPAVRSPTLVRGHVSASSQLVAYLFVRPIASDQCWLQRPAPLQVSPEGHWETEAYLGGAGGQRFELWAVATGDTLSDFVRPGRYPCTSIPGRAARSVKTVVSR